MFEGQTFCGPLYFSYNESKAEDLSALTAEMPCSAFAAVLTVAGASQAVESLLITLETSGLLIVKL